MPKALPKEYLAPDDWIKAGFRALAETGPASVQINQLAKSLGATKGSFYWHFKGFKDLKASMLRLWRQKVVEEVQADISAVPPGVERLALLVRRAAQGPDTEFGGRRIDTAMRAWALADSEVAAALSEIDRARLAMVQDVLASIGLRDPDLAPLVYGCYLGVDDLVARGAVENPYPLSKLHDLLVAMAPVK
ncbi:MAG: TetR/AcrR family transcriptional regulator [Maritimibacter sp.]